MAYTQASNKAVQKYSSKTYDQIKIVVKKGEREKIKAHAESKGLSLNKYINNLIYDDINNNQTINNE